MMLTLNVLPFQLKLRHTFRITHGSRDYQPTVIVSLSDGVHTGYGEATATRYYGLVQEEMLHRFNKWKPIIESTPLETAESYWEILHPLLKDHPFEQCALDEAAHDLIAQNEGLPLYKKWGLTYYDQPLTDYTLGFGPLEEMIAKMEEMPWPVYKIKLGTENDLDIIQHLRKHTSAIFRVDANTAWTARQTLEYAPELKKYGVEFIEQPLKPDDWDGQKLLFEKCDLPIIADESCQKEEDVSRCAGYFHGVNIKLMKCGGLTPALRMIQEAKKRNMKVMVGCMTESSIGITAIAHLLPLLDYVDMDGALLLSNDPAEGVLIQHGKVRFPERNGIGAKLI
jgi:L-alanine-DL-glutamate epimerase-like enolase superfamily enzyme